MRANAFKKLAGAVVVAAVVLAQAASAQQTDTFTDARDGKTYRTAVMPDGKTWMAENLSHQTANSWCLDNEAECAKYGRLYDWNAARSACPAGWRLPTRQEWGAMVIAAGGTGAHGADHESPAGTRLKAARGWHDDESCCTDDYGFAALGGGARNNVQDVILYEDSWGGWWTATESDRSKAWRRNMGMFTGVGEAADDKADGMSVRCIKE